MFKKIKFKIELLVSYFKKKYILLIVGLLIGSAIFLSKNFLISFFNSPSLQTRVIGVEGLYTTSNLPEEITNLISLGLTTNSENNKPLLSPLVVSYELQNDNKDYIFTLKNDIFWQNNKKFTAYDINYQIPGISFIPLSDDKIKVSLENEFSPLLSTLNKPLFKKNLIGLGPYKVKEITYQEGRIKSLKLKPLKENQETLYYRFYPNEKDLVDAYKIGDVDEITITNLPNELSKWSKTKINQEVRTNKNYSAVFLNTKKLGNKQLRQALAYATPKSKDKNERCLGPISPNSWAYNPLVKEYAYNPTRAKELFENNKIDKINLSVNDRKLLPVADEIKNAWSSILGIDVSVTIENQIDPQNFEAVLAYGGISHDPDQYLFWHSTQTKTNLTQLDNSRIDKLLEEGRQIYDFQERKKIYQDFQKFLLEESPTIFLSYPTTYTVTRIK